MRTNRQLKNEWTKKIRFADNYTIEILMLCTEESQTTLNIYLDIDGENIDDECLMCIDEFLTEPTPEMRKKFKSVTKYFKEYFENVKATDKIVIV